MRGRLWPLYLAAGLAVAVGSLRLPDLQAAVVYVLHLEPFPSPADGLYLASYPLLAASLLVMIRSRTGGRDRAGLVDLGAVIVYAGLTTYEGYNGGVLDIGG